MVRRKLCRDFHGPNDFTSLCAKHAKKTAKKYNSLQKIGNEIVGRKNPTIQDNTNEYLGGLFLPVNSFWDFTSVSCIYLNSKVSKNCMLRRMIQKCTSTPLSSIIVVGNDEIMRFETKQIFQVQSWQHTLQKVKEGGYNYAT